MKKNNDGIDGRDQELDQLLKPLMSASPNDLDLKKWKNAIGAAAPKRQIDNGLYPNTKVAWAFQLVAAVFVGIIIGALAFKTGGSTEGGKNLVAQISLDDATYERSHDNLD